MPGLFEDTHWGPLRWKVPFEMDTPLSGRSYFIWCWFEVKGMAGYDDAIFIYRYMPRAYIWSWTATRYSHAGEYRQLLQQAILILAFDIIALGNKITLLLRAVHHWGGAARALHYRRRITRGLPTQNATVWRDDRMILARKFELQDVDIYIRRRRGSLPRAEFRCSMKAMPPCLSRS